MKLWEYFLYTKKIIYKKKDLLGQPATIIKSTTMHACGSADELYS